MVGAGTCDSLDRANAALGRLDLVGGVFRIEAEHQVSSQLEEGNVAFDSGIFMSEEVVLGK